MKHERRSMIITANAELPGDYRVRVGEHEERGFVAIDVGRGGHAVMLEPAQMVTLAGELLAIAGNIIDRQFRRQLGSP